MAPTACSKAANLWISRLIPLILVGIVGYVTWVVVVLVCIKYLIHPRDNLHTPQHGSAIAVLILYFLLLFMMSWTYLRLLHTVTFNPGYVPRGPQWHAENDPKKSDDSFNADTTPSGGSPAMGTGGADEQDTGNGAGTFQPCDKGLISGGKDFFLREVYVCKGDGMPVWCSSCMVWKPDRAHHCREVDRCVRKMDHFCPWVGGVVSETSFNFFIQFTAWTAVFCAFNLIHMAVFVAQYRKATGTANVNWIIAMALAALFALFTFGMTLSSLNFVLVNTTTIENLSRKTIVWDLAVHVASDWQAGPVSTINFSTRSLVSPEVAAQLPESEASRRFAILHSKPGASPWDLGPMKNFESVMGLRWYEWIFPISHSPCCDHTRQRSQFDMGPVINHMRQEVGLSSLDVNEVDETELKAQLNESEPKKRRRPRHSRFIVAGPDETSPIHNEKVNNAPEARHDATDMV